MTRAFYWFAYALFLLTALGCAHVAAVATACKPTAVDVDTAFADLRADDWQTELEALAIAKGVCIARAAVQEVIDALGGSQSLEMVGTPSSADIVSRGKAWLTAHPNTKETP